MPGPLRKLAFSLALAAFALSAMAWTRHYSFRNGYPANVNRSVESNAVLKSPKASMTTRMIVVTNRVLVAQCQAVVDDSGSRCRRKAVRGSRFCRKHRQSQIKKAQ